MALDLAQPLAVDDVGKKRLLARYIARHSHAFDLFHHIISSGLLSFLRRLFDDAVYDIGCGDGRVLIEMACRSIPFIADANEDVDELSANCDYQTNSCNNNNHVDVDSIARMSSPNYPSRHYCKQFVGIEISSERANEARSNIQHAKKLNQIPSHVSIEIICANALDTNRIDYSRATVIFLYLVPRGLRLIKPIVWPTEEEEEEEENYNFQSQTQTTELTSTQLHQQQIGNNKKPKGRRRVIISYMSPFEDEEYVRKEFCHVDHQVGSAWPVYLYRVS